MVGRIIPAWPLEVVLEHDAGEAFFNHGAVLFAVGVRLQDVLDGHGGSPAKGVALHGERDFCAGHRLPGRVGHRDHEVALAELLNPRLGGRPPGRVRRLAGIGDLRARQSRHVKPQAEGVYREVGDLDHLFLRAELDAGPGASGCVGGVRLERQAELPPLVSDIEIEAERFFVGWTGLLEDHPGAARAALGLGGKGARKKMGPEDFTFLDPACGAELKLHVPQFGRARRDLAAERLIERLPRDLDVRQGAIPCVGHLAHRHAGVGRDDRRPAFGDRGGGLQQGGQQAG